MDNNDVIRRDANKWIDSCWIYVTHEGESQPFLYIKYAADLQQLLKECENKQLLYYRQFITTMEGLSHKLLLSNLDTNTVYGIIREVNPSLRNLRNDFLANIKDSHT